MVPILWNSNVFGDSIAGTDPSQGPNGTGEYRIGYAMNDPSLFNKNGFKLDTADFVNRSTLEFQEQFYQKHQPIYISTFFAYTYMTDFMVFAAVFSHIALWYGKDIWRRFRTAMADLDKDDVHAKLMVPKWLSQ
jgi:hypothetical protein